MNNSTIIKYNEQFKWLLSGIDFSLKGNGGPDCVQYLSLKYRVVETAFILFISMVEIIWGLKRIRFDDTSNAKPQFCYSNSSNSSNVKLRSLNLQSYYKRPLLKTVLLVLVSLIFGIEIGFKFSTNTLIFLLNPCHLLTISLIYLLAVDERKPSKVVTFVFRIHLHILSGALLAIVFPVVNTRFLSFEAHSYWIHHILIYIGPGYLLTVGGPFSAEPLTNQWWPILSIGIGFFYHFFVLQGLGMITQANLNNMLCPAFSDPFEGPYYRVWAFGHQHLLNFIHGKLYQICTFAVVCFLYKSNEVAAIGPFSRLKLNGRFVRNLALGQVKLNCKKEI